MNEDAYHQLMETHWQRKLTPAEEVELQAYLTAHPEARADWETDTALNRMLDGLPEAPAVSSNFTAQVLLAVKRETAARPRAGWRAWLRLEGWTPKAAAASAMVVLISFAYERHEMMAREAMARRVASVARAVSASPELLENYDRIRRLGDTPPKGDTDLLALMK